MPVQWEEKANTGPSLAPAGRLTLDPDEVHPDGSSQAPTLVGSAQLQSNAIVATTARYGFRRAAKWMLVATGAAAALFVVTVIVKPKVQPLQPQFDLSGVLARE